MFAYRLSLNACHAEKVTLHEAVTVIVEATGLTVAAVVHGLRVGAAYTVGDAAFVLAD